MESSFSDVSLGPSGDIARDRRELTHCTRVFRKRDGSTSRPLRQLTPLRVSGRRRLLGAWREASRAARRLESARHRGRKNGVKPRPARPAGRPRQRKDDERNAVFRADGTGATGRDVSHHGSRRATDGCAVSHEFPNGINLQPGIRTVHQNGCHNRHGCVRPISRGGHFRVRQSITDRVTT
jgi:hypothetical protein